MHSSSNQSTQQWHIQYALICGKPYLQRTERQQSQKILALSCKIYVIRIIKYFMLAKHFKYKRYIIQLLTTQSYMSELVNENLM